MNEHLNSLVWNAVPTLFEVPNQPPKIISSRRVIRRQDTAQQSSSPAATVASPSDAMITSQKLVGDHITANCSVAPSSESSQRLTIDKMLMAIESMSKLRSSSKPGEIDVPGTLTCEMSCDMMI